MEAYIVAVEHDKFVGIVVNKGHAGNFLIYLNTSARPLLEVKKEISDINDVQIKKQIPEEISKIAQKVSLICQGLDQDTSEVTLDYSGYTEKQIQVIKTAMKIPVNELWPYSKVALESGLPKAQRFVGTTMRVLRQPYIVPVHRVKSISYIRKKQRTNKKSFTKMPI